MVTDGTWHTDVLTDTPNYYNRYYIRYRTFIKMQDTVKKSGANETQNQINRYVKKLIKCFNLKVKLYLFQLSQWLMRKHVSINF